MIRSMTGFSSVEGMIAGQKMRLEIKALNHRFLDLKIRLPRELSACEIQLRAALQARVSRGSIELKVERIADSASTSALAQPNLALAANYYEALITLQKTLGLTDTIRTLDIASFPEVMGKPTVEVPVEEAWKALESLLDEGMTKLEAMREHEGMALVKVLLGNVSELEEKLEFLRKRRAECQDLLKAKTKSKIQAVFDTYPITDLPIHQVLESRIAQELAVLLDRTDIEEELTRFGGHLTHLRKTLDTGGQVGRKLEFILQELGREINTLGNKAQDLQVGEEVVQVKVRLEQVREQALNLE